jgi:hypothetical protein
LLAALGHEEELAMHIRATKNTGATEDDDKGSIATYSSLCRHSCCQLALLKLQRKFLQKK